MNYAVGVDIGGTFTDVCVLDTRDGSEVIEKVPTTPEDLSQGLMEGLSRAASRNGIELQELLRQTSRFAHATTQTTNVMFTWERGASVGLLTTRGFGDEIHIMRARGRVAGLGLSERRHLRATDKPQQIVQPSRIREVPERVDQSGEVLLPLDPAKTRQAIRQLLDDGVDSFAVSLLWGHVNPGHEIQIRELVKEISPGTHVSISSDIAPVTGEYERVSTTVVNAYVAPTLEKYLVDLQRRLKSEGLKVPILVFQASGGVSTSSAIQAVSTIESGPAGGMVAAAELSSRTELSRAIATDVGGTTFKVGLIDGGRWSMAPETVINQYALQSPMIDIVSIGAGGGSIAWADDERLRIGPMSAGASPGPACYGWGGTLPTVTDADLLLGILDPHAFLDGRMVLDEERAREAMQPMADQLFAGDVLAAAAGVREVADSHMGDLIRKTTIERGFDPREFTVIAFGGAGPVHAASYSRAASVERLVVPFDATIFSAYGIVVADAIRVLQRSVPGHESQDGHVIEDYLRQLRSDARAELVSQGFSESTVSVHFWADMRYERQLHDVRVTFGTRLPTLSALQEEFTAQYNRLYGAGAQTTRARTRVIRVGVEAFAANTISLRQEKKTGRGSPPEHKGTRQVYWPELRRWQSTKVYEGLHMRPADIVEGPAIINQPATCVVVPPGTSAWIDPLRNIHIDLIAGDPHRRSGKAEQ